MKIRKIVKIKCDGKIYRINSDKIIYILTRLGNKYMQVQDEDDILVLMVKYNLFEKHILEKIKDL